MGECAGRGMAEGVGRGTGNGIGCGMDEGVGRGTDESGSWSPIEGVGRGRCHAHVYRLRRRRRRRGRQQHQGRRHLRPHRTHGRRGHRLRRRRARLRRLDQRAGRHRGTPHRPHLPGLWIPGRPRGAAVQPVRERGRGDLHGMGHGRHRSPAHAHRRRRDAVQLRFPLPSPRGSGGSAVQLPAGHDIQRPVPHRARLDWRQPRRGNAHRRADAQREPLRAVAGQPGRDRIRRGAGHRPDALRDAARGGGLHGRVLPHPPERRPVRRLPEHLRAGSGGPPERAQPGAGRHLLLPQLVLQRPGRSAGRRCGRGPHGDDAVRAPERWMCPGRG